MGQTDNQEKPQQGYTTNDNAIRCKYCNTILSQIVIKISSTVDPFIPCAKAVICRKCGNIRNGHVLKGMDKLGIKPENVKALLKESKNADMFKITELQSGKMEHVKYSPFLVKWFFDHPELTKEKEPVNESSVAYESDPLYKPIEYNPDKFLGQQEQMFEEEL